MTAELRVLAGVEAYADGVRLDVGHARQRCVLAALVVDVNRVVTVDQLIERVWAGRLPHQVRQVLRNYVSRLRQALAPCGVTIERQSGGYLLAADPDIVDMHRFRRLIGEAAAAGSSALYEQALELWQGEAFAGLDTPWVDNVRRALEQDRFAAESDHIDLALRQGRHASLLTTLLLRASAHPMDERVAAQVMLALYRSGRQADALTHYEKLRLRLVEELGIDPSPDLRRLHRQILTADATLLPVPPRPMPVPQQLPAPPRSFTGRTAELAALTDLSSTVVIGGTGGIGKTWLALRWAHDHLDEFPDGQLYVNLHGFDPSDPPTRPAVALRGFLDALGVDPAAIPVDPGAQAGLFRSLIAGKRMLIVLDNARDSEQIIPLLPGSSSCCVLVTSRHRLGGLVAGHGATRLDLDVFDSKDARELLASQVGADRVAAEPEAVAELLAVCAGLPLALRIVAARAAVHPGFPLSVLVSELQRSSGRLDALDAGELNANLRTALSVSFHALSSEAASVFTLLGAVPGPDISLTAVAALAELSVSRAGVLLRELEALYLVTQHSPNRYSVHDLVRLYAVECPTDPEALPRLTDFYLRTANTGAHLLYPHRQALDLAPGLPLADEASALAWFDAEHAVLLAVSRLAEDEGWDRIVWQLAWTLNPFHRRRGHLHDDISVWQAGLAAAQRLGDTDAQAWAHRFLAHAHMRLGLDNHVEATQQLRAALSDHGEKDLPDIIATSLDFYRSTGDTLWEADALAVLGWLSAEHGDTQQARSYCESALPLFRRHHDRVGEAAALDSLGYITHNSGRHNEALRYYREALALRRSVGDAYNEADTLSRLGDIHAALGQAKEAIATWHQALELYQTQNRGTHADRIYRNLTHPFPRR
jgi:DNA-binding SARP family transcriptional activator